jgi:hypothetical protein
MSQSASVPEGPQAVTPQRSPLLRTLTAIGALVVIAVLIFAMLRSCGNILRTDSADAEALSAEFALEPCEDGERGAPGLVGATGPQGSEGDTGPKGSSGEPGVAGVAGPEGDSGPTGPQGDPGAPGLPGADGQPGPQGETGPEGPAGPTGAQGEIGPAGAPCEGPPVYVTGIVVGESCTYTHGNGSNLLGTIQWNVEGNHAALWCVPN